jgi:hypothetical protein
MGETVYTQPFLQRTPLEQYPEITAFVKKQFPTASLDVARNLYILICPFLHVSAYAASRRDDWYRSVGGPEWFNVTAAVHAQDLLEQRGFVELKKGYRRRGYETGFASVLRSAKPLEDMLRKIELKPVVVDFRGTPHLTIDRFPLDARIINGLATPNVVRIGDISQERLAQLHHQMVDFNRGYFSKIGIGFDESVSLPRTMDESRAQNGNTALLAIARNVFLTRMFSGRGMGRMYQRSLSYQNVKKELRGKLLVNGERAAELDFSSMHINLAYFLSKQKNPHLEDSYLPIVHRLVPNVHCLDDGDESLLRDYVKQCVLVAFNTPNKGSYLKAMRWNYKEETGALLTHGILLEHVYDAFAHVHPAIARAFINKEHKPDLLMYHESTIMMTVLDRLRAQSIPALPIHDGLLCPVQHADTVCGEMAGRYGAYTGREIIVKKKIRPVAGLPSVGTQNGAAHVAVPKTL